MWRKLLKYRDLAKNFHRKEIHNGLNTSFWFDAWSPLGRLVDLTGVRGHIDLGIPASTTVATVLSSHRRRRHRWDHLNRIEDAIEEIRTRGLRENHDISLWKSEENKFHKKFSSQKTWRLIKEAQPHVDWFRGVWFPRSIPKYSFITWIAMRNRLSTADRMKSWDQRISSDCNLCSNSEETRNHLFFSCPFSQLVWSALVQRLLQIRYTYHWNGLQNLINDSPLDEIPLFLLRYVFQSAVYHIWSERNNRKNGNPEKPASYIIKIIDKNVRNRISAIRNTGDRRYDDGMATWFASRPNNNH